jgi:putative ABC transport system substrate-binding protein
LSWLKRILPRAKTIGVIYNPGENQEQVDKASIIARQMKLNFLPQRVNSPKEIPQALDALSRKADVLWGIPDKMVFTPQTAKQILLFSFRHRIPFVGLSSSWVKAGALYSLDWDYREEGRECGATALRILKNKKMDEISSKAKNSVKYSLNLKTAEKMKIDIPEKLVKQAKNVY